MNLVISDQSKEKIQIDLSSHFRLDNASFIIEEISDQIIYNIS